MYVMGHSEHKQFFILFSDFIEILFFFLLDDEEAHDTVVT